MSVMAGVVDFSSQSGTLYEISNWQKMRHPKYVDGKAYYDVALVYVEDKLDYNDFVQPICLPESVETDQDSHKNAMVKLLGMLVNGEQRELVLLSIKELDFRFFF